jgi:protein SCO1/2
MSRRSFLQAAIASLPIFNDHGRIKPPVMVPGIALVRQDGAAANLGKLVLGHATAVQLMFTSCSTTCPIQAAIFQRVQKLVPDMAAKGIQLLSLSVNPAVDTPQALSAWLNRFHAGPNWIAAAPAAKDGPLVQSFFGQANGSYADHSTQVNIVDRRGRLVWRTVELPTAGEIAGVLQKL